MIAFKVPISTGTPTGWEVIDNYEELRTKKVKRWIKTKVLEEEMHKLRTSPATGAEKRSFAHKSTKNIVSKQKDIVWLFWLNSQTGWSDDES